MKNLLFCSILILAIGCNSTKAKKEALTDSTLNAGAYKITSIVGTDVSTENLTLVVSEDGQSISGFCGCNKYFGTVESTANGLAFSGLGATKKFCPDAMETEKSFLAQMRNVTAAVTKDSQVNLSSENGDTVITLKR